MFPTQVGKELTKDSWENVGNGNSRSCLGLANASKKERQSYFHHFRNRKNRKKVDDFLFLPITGSRVIAIFLNGWIFPIGQSGGASQWRFL